VFVYHGSWPFLNREQRIFAVDSVGSFQMEERKGRVSYVIGPDGSPLTLADLPPPSTRRWVIRRKAEVVAAVRGGLLSLDDACKRYTLTVEEFLAWQHAIDRFGLAGLRATRVQQYRN
jgi:hypothetical protein